MVRKRKPLLLGEGAGLAVAGIIPARYGSTRFCGKPLANQTGKFLIQHVYEQVAAAERIDRVIVATDDERIVRAVESFGGQAELTASDHPSGTDRVAEAAASLPEAFDLVVNVQGDEPEIEPASIDRLVELMDEDLEAAVGTLACPFPPQSDPHDPNCVKVVVDRRGRALYFSRSLIPYPRDSRGQAGAAGDWLLHLGVYAYRRGLLSLLTTLAPTRLEETERLEQLRVLEHSYKIAVGLVDKATVGIDTPEEYAAFVGRVSPRRAVDS